MKRPRAYCIVASLAAMYAMAIASSLAHAAARPATVTQTMPVPLSAYEVKLRPCDTRADRNKFQVFSALGMLRSRATEVKSFTLPPLSKIEMWLTGKDVVWSLRTPSGKVIVPGKGENCTACKFGIVQHGIISLSIKHPESGTWSVLAKSSRADTMTYAVDIWPDGPADESPHLEMLLGDSDPRPSVSAKPGEVVFIRTFLTRRGRLLPGTRWVVRALTPRDSLIAIPVFDDGRHADGAAGDGICVGALRTDAQDGLYRIRAETHTSSGIAYVLTETIDVEVENDLLLADAIVASPVSPIAGKAMTVTVTARNAGSIEFKNVELELFVDAVKVSSQRLDLKAGEARRVATTWVPPRSQVYTLQLTLNGYEETGDFTNNTTRMIIRVR